MEESEDSQSLILGDKKAVETKARSGTKAREAISAVEREGHYGWLSFDAVKKYA